MPGPIFTDGERITLRTIEDEDLEFIQRWRNHTDVRIPLTDTDIRNGEQMDQYLEEQISETGSINLLICTDTASATDESNRSEDESPGSGHENDDPKPVGEVAIPWVQGTHGSGMLMYWIAPAHQGHGYATEAAELVVDHAFRERRLNKIWAHVLESNIGSQRVLEKLGFTQEGRLRQNYFIEGDFEDAYHYGLLAEEW